MDWKTKSKIQNAVSLLPGSLSNKFYYILQRHFGSLRTANPVPGLKAGIETCEVILDAGRDISDKVVLEIGTGWALNTPIALWLCGAKRIITVDLNTYLKPEIVRRDLAYIYENPEKVKGLFGTHIIHDRFERLLGLAKQKRGLSDLLHSLDIEYVAPADAGHLELPAGSVDYHISYNVLEHVPPEAIASILIEGRRLIRDKGLFVHRIDFSDHFAHADGSISLLNFLRYDDREWGKIVRNRFMYVNRLRVDDMERIFTSAGQGILSLYSGSDDSVSGLISSGKLPLDEKYKSKSEKVLNTIYCWIVSEKGSKGVS